MVVLDTNVVSELMHREPDEKVLIWIDNQPTQELFVTSVTEAEIRAGIAFLPEGVRRRGLAKAAGHTFSDLFAGRILPFDSAAACVYAEIVAARRASGRPLSQADGQIAAIVRSRGMTVATRNVRDFSETGIEVIDPWEVK